MDSSNFDGTILDQTNSNSSGKKTLDFKNLKKNKLDQIDALEDDDDQCFGDYYEDDPYNSIERARNLAHRIVFTETGEFVRGLELDEAPKAVVAPKKKDQIGEKEGNTANETTREAAVGKGLSGALGLLRERGALREGIGRGGRDTDKKKRKIVGVAGSDEPEEIRIERLDKFGRTMTPNEAFRVFSHRFHGKRPGKMKREKRLKQYHQELKSK